ncbi:hypothetical protein BJ508DRAFT_365960 [Ascobolus immersus RN42]|uniref:BTB domain-containing protein n=1 Tax=Ascobolus immersus RN42 TaxID=1160509 RepID=A0A3N4HMH4_ASCIM|nr:hypothetical protein BJ508DRAFT_365960 [Ascobolus immersus RN42]
MAVEKDPFYLNQFTQPPSTIYSSPTITINLGRFVSSDDVTTTGDSDVPRKRPRVSDSFDDDATLVSRFEVIASFHLHVLGLTTHSLYFAGLISFNGREVAENHVDFEAPWQNLDDEFARIAFSCFADFIYSGNYDVSRYSLSCDGKRVTLQRLGVHLIINGMVYVLGERILAEGLKKVALKKVYRLFYGYHLFERLNTEDKFSDTLPRVRMYLASFEYPSRWAVNYRLAIDILFKHTPRKCGPAWEPPTPTEDNLVAKPDEKPFFTSIARAFWAGKEPMRNLFAAFFASIWNLPRAEDGRPVPENAIENRRLLIADQPEFMEHLLGYLTAARGKCHFMDLPITEFGLELSDGDEVKTMPV